MRNSITKAASIILVLVIMLCFVACGETAQQKRNRLERQQEQSKARLDELQREYDDLQEQLSRIQRLQDAIDNAKKP